MFKEHQQNILNLLYPEEIAHAEEADLAEESRELIQFLCNHKLLLKLAQTDILNRTHPAIVLLPDSPREDTGLSETLEIELDVPSLIAKKESSIANPIMKLIGRVHISYRRSDLIKNGVRNSSQFLSWIEEGYPEYHVSYSNYETCDWAGTRILFYWGSFRPWEDHVKFAASYGKRLHAIYSKIESLLSLPNENEE
jgi:hypothetical protein